MSVGRLGMYVDQELRYALGGEGNRIVGSVRDLTGFDPAVRMNIVVPLFARQIQLFRRQDRPLDVMADTFVAVIDFGERCLRGIQRVFVRIQQRAGREIVEQAGGLFKEQRQVELDALWRKPVADVAVDDGFLRIAGQAAAIGAPELRDAVFRQRELLCRQ